MTSLSVIVPVRDGAAYLPDTLPAILRSLPEGGELIVSDDGSRDGSAEVAAKLGALVVRHAVATGPAGARNRGALVARGDTLVFLDADVRVHADTLALLVEPLQEPAVAAAFGSYDDRPPGASWISFYKNLAHHFVHQRSQRDAFTFWAGCGAIRRRVLFEVGGFDEAYRRPSIEDVELGHRLRRGGYAIRLTPRAQVTHLKIWTLWSWLVSDLRDRAIPWARLLRAGAGLPRDLNFRWADRAAVMLVAIAVLALCAAPVEPRLLVLAGASLVAACLMDRAFLAFCARTVSPFFAAAAAVLHSLHRAAGLFGLVVGLITPAPPSRLGLLGASETESGHGRRRGAG